MPAYRSRFVFLCSACAMILLLSAGCDTSMGGMVPAGSTTPNAPDVASVQGPAGPQGPQGAQGPPGPQGPPGTNATVTAGEGIAVNAGEVSLDAVFTDMRYWKQGGNANIDPAAQFLGTTDDRPMDIRANNRRALRLEHAMRDDGAQLNRTLVGLNVIGGYDGNSVTPGVIGATVFGGYEINDNGIIETFANKIMSDVGTIGGGSNNVVSGSFGAILGGTSNEAGVTAVVGGGAFNNATGQSAFIGGGQLNQAIYFYTTVCGGNNNRAQEIGSFIGGGENNLVSAALGVVAGGRNNKATGLYSTVPGGSGNEANGARSFAAGYQARADHDGCFVWADSGRGNVFTPSYGPNQFFVASSGGIRLTRANSLSGLSTTTTNAAVMVEKLDGGGEALWIRQRLSEDTIPVIKMHRAPSGDNDFVQGLDWSPPNAPVQKFHINKNGTYVAGGDFAESLRVVGKIKNYEPGDVLVLSESQGGRVKKCVRRNDTRVAGVYSTRPGLLGADKGQGDIRVDKDEVPVAIIGIVPTKVCDEGGPIRPGDLLTTSSTPGHAMKAVPQEVQGAVVYPTGAILGKAMEPLRKGRGMIRVLVTLK